MFGLIYKWTDKIKEKIAALSEKMGEKGQGMTEYALILAAVAIIATVAIWGSDNSLKKAVTSTFTTATTKIDSANAQTGQ